MFLKWHRVSQNHFSLCNWFLFFFRRNGSSTEVKGFVEKCNSRESRIDRDSSGVTNVLTSL